MVEELPEDNPELQWVQLQQDLYSNTGVESDRERMMRKVRSNPFVPIGVLATTMALCYGLYSFKTGQKKMSQYMMRTRIAAQGFTVVAVLLGLGLSAVSKNEEGT